MDAQELRNLQEAYREVVENKQLDEISQKTATRAYAASKTGEFEGKDSPRDVKRSDNLKRQIKRKFGDKAVKHANRAAHSRTFGRKGLGGMPPKPTKEEFELWVNSLVEEGYDLSGYTWDDMYEFYLDEDSRRTSNKQHTARVRSNIKSFGSNYTPPSNFDPDANRGKGEVLTRKQIEKKRRKSLRQEEFVNEADSLAAMQARREKRLATQRKREGTTSTGRDFGHNYSLTPAQQKARRDAEFKAGTKKEEVDLYDIILSHLLGEGYAETPEAAKAIMVNMSEEWRNSIIECD